MTKVKYKGGKPCKWTDIQIGDIFIFDYEYYGDWNTGVKMIKTEDINLIPKDKRKYSALMISGPYTGMYHPMYNIEKNNPDIYVRILSRWEN